VASDGGDEFIVLLPASAETAAHDVGDRIPKRIAESPLEVATVGRVGISVSIGLETLPVAAANVEDRLRNAGQALYAGKRAGHNRLSTFASPAAA
jgi:diguanylate cyclase (GGDEF)-like protein